MPEQTIQAIYHEGVFQPTEPAEVVLQDGERVELSIRKIDEEAETERTARIERIMNIIEHFYDGVDEAEIDAIERSILQRVNFVGIENKVQFD
jgi:predicted DNA-binding antitoxin AbrB/MazE fold protein